MLHIQLTARRGASPAQRWPIGILIGLLLALATAAPASADDLFDDSLLRGPFSASGHEPIRWDGFYVGGQVAYSNLSSDFGQGSASLVAYILRNTTVENEDKVSTWTTLPKVVSSASSYGGFAGYNFQMDELVIGADVAYNHSNSQVATATDSIGRSVRTSDGYQNDVNVSAQATLRLIDYATVRARAGYAIGQFLPYAFVGAAVGRFEYSTSATVTASGTDVSGGGGLPYSFGPQTDTTTKSNAYAVGLDFGLGTEVAILPNVFLRGEWEYIYFSNIDKIKPTLNTARLGLGVRF
jgi:opacity protein-like surface antigen